MNEDYIIAAAQRNSNWHKTITNNLENNRTKRNNSHDRYGTVGNIKQNENRGSEVQSAKSNKMKTGTPK